MSVIRSWGGGRIPPASAAEILDLAGQTIDLLGERAGARSRSRP